jgi:hypothetical protein
VPPKRRFLQEPHGVTSQKTPFFIVTAVKTSNLTLSAKCCVCAIQANSFFILLGRLSVSNTETVKGVLHGCLTAGVDTSNAIRCGAFPGTNIGPCTGQQTANIEVYASDVTIPLLRQARAGHTQRNLGPSHAPHTMTFIVI